jgi:hypothetical protein
MRPTTIGNSKRQEEQQRIKPMDFSLSPLGYDDDCDLSIKCPILMDYIDMAYRIYYDIPNVKIA